MHKLITHLWHSSLIWFLEVFCWNPSGFYSMSHPSLCIVLQKNLSLLQVLTYQFVWLHCALGTQTWTNTKSQVHLRARQFHKNSTYQSFVMIEFLATFYQDYSSIKYNFLLSHSKPKRPGGRFLICGCLRSFLASFHTFLETPYSHNIFASQTIPSFLALTIVQVFSVIWKYRVPMKTFVKLKRCKTKK